MGGVVSPAMVSAVAEAGGIGLMPGSMGSAYARDFFRTMSETTNRPFGANIPVGFSEPGVVDTLLELGVRYVTTSTGPVPAFTTRLQTAGVPVLHVVTSLDDAKRAADAGVDGLIVEGAEGAGLRGDVAMMVLLPLVTSQVDLPVIAAGGHFRRCHHGRRLRPGRGGRADGHAHGRLGRVAVHENFKQAVVSAAETDTLLIDRHQRRPVRVLRTESTAPYEFATRARPSGPS